MKKVLLLIIKNVMLNLFQHRKDIHLCDPETSSGRRTFNVLFLLFINLFVSQTVFAYQTVLVDFPPNQGWHSDYYDAQTGEIILQYVPIGESCDNWDKTVIFHSYKNLSWTNSAAALMDRLTQQMELQNSTQFYKYMKYTAADSIATRCIKKNAKIGTQCEIFRTSQSFDGLISMHYINRNVQDFQSSYAMWYEIMKNIRIYYSYYMDDSILNKATSFQM